MHLAQIDAYGSVKVNKVLHLAFATTDFEGYLNFLNDNGIHYINEETKKIQIRPDGVKQIYFQDPGGYWIEINNASHQ